ncbi:MAG: hypothetical protein AAGG57_11255, partial [Pseudomonadota bacterium]
RGIPCPDRTSTCRNFVTISSGFGRLLAMVFLRLSKHSGGPLQRGKTRVSYVDVVDFLIRLRNAQPWGGKSKLVIDGTSIGRVVSDMLSDQGVDHMAIQMTGGQEWKRSGKYINASKTLMIENTAVLFASGELKIAHDLAIKPEIEQDLASFTIETTAAGNTIITQRRSAGGHGDMGIALVVGCFAAQYLKPQTATQGTLEGWY